MQCRIDKSRCSGGPKVPDGYANFAIADPPLKLVLFAGGGQPGSLNHLGVEVESAAEVMAADARARGEELPTELEESTTCCFAMQDKVWVQGPDNVWEFYTVLADAPVDANDDACCHESATPVVLGASAAGRCRG